MPYEPCWRTLGEQSPVVEAAGLEAPSVRPGGGSFDLVAPHDLGRPRGAGVGFDGVAGDGEPEHGEVVSSEVVLGCGEVPKGVVRVADHGVDGRVCCTLR